MARRKKRKKRIGWNILSLAGILVLAGLFVGLSAKYAHQETAMNPVTSKSFYFTSDVLSEEGSSYTLSSDTTKITFELRNYEDDLRWSDSDIEYSYNVTKSDDNSSERRGSGTIAYSVSDKSEESITINDLKAGTYTVTAEATKPYSKTLTGTFTIPSEDAELSYTVSDQSGSPYALLTISTGNYSGKITISWPTGVIPDGTQDIFSSVNTYQSGSYTAGTVSVTMKPYSSNTYRFFKTDPQIQYTTATITATKAQ